jgi:hypothetical protein
LSVGSGGESKSTLPDFYTTYSGKKNEYESLLKTYEAGGSKDIGQYNELTKKQSELKAFGVAAYGLEIGRNAATETTTTTAPQSGALPIIGVVPGVSSVVSMFQPVETKTTVKNWAGSQTTSTFGATPFTTKVQEYAPDQKITNPIFRMADLTNPYSMPFALAGMTSEKLTDTFNPSKSAEMRQTNTMLEGYTGLGGKYNAIREDPAMAVVSYTTGAALGGVGGGLRSVGVGTKYLAPASKAGELYQAGSQIATGVIGTMYASDVSKRVTGTSFGEFQQAFIAKDLGGSGGFSEIQKNWQGPEYAQNKLNVITMTELVPFVVGVGTGAKVGDWVSDRFRTKGMNEIPKPEEFTYFTKEGFPTNKDITTRDLRESFNQGTMKIRGDIMESKMAPDMKPIERVPSHPQRDTALFGETHIYSGAETPYLNTNVVSGGHSEIPGMYNAPTGQAHFTKAGMNQGGGGFGMSNDILGIYRNPIMYRSTVKTGDYVEIPEAILKTPKRGMSINDPLNPRNQAISEWMEVNAPYGKPVYGQYGKPEWQSLIKEGSQLKREPLGYFTDKPTGRRIVMESVEFTGTGVAPTKSVELNPLSGKPLGKPIGKFFSGLGESSMSGSSKTVAPLVSLTFGSRSVSSTQSSRGNPFGGYSARSPSYPSSVRTSGSSVSPSSRGISSEWQGSSRSPSGRSSGLLSSELFGSSRSPSRSSTLSSPSRSPSGYSSLISSITSPPSSPKPPSYTAPDYTTPPSYRKTTYTEPPYSPPPYTPITPVYTPPISTPPSTPTKGGGFLWPGGQDVSPKPTKAFRKLREVLSLRSQLWR